MSHQDPAPAPGSNREDSLFAAARQRSSSERAAFLEGACVGDSALRERLELRLLLADQTEQGLVTRVEGVQETLHLDIADFPSDECVGQMLGRYKLLEKVGEGGCGVVYVAEQTEPVRRRVALKVIKLGMDTKAVVARFEAERQALAMMDHPNIARVLDAGTTERGRPFFVMELVRGVRITDFCDQSNLSTRDRLELFIKVCHAIQHAHQKGIIHRDIKPSNILVTLHDGVPVPKVIDFGIAKATEGRLTEATVYTQLNQFIGTPAYMSPEQAEMSGLDIDTRSDIYSLGVLLYELLTGRTPFDFQSLMSQGLDAMRRAIREDEPARPSTRLATLKGEELTTTAKRRSVEAPRLANLLKGDLDWIVMKALEKDRTRRYDTANGLAMDLGRHLANEPVLARPPSLGYRFQKAVRRNRLAFTAGSAVAAALIVGLVLSATQTVRARQAEKLAASRLVESEKLRADSEVARQEAEAIATFMSDVFYNPDPARDANKITVVETLSRAADGLQGQLKDQPARRASLQRTLSRSYSGLGLHIEAARLQADVQQFYQAQLGAEHTNTLDISTALADSLAAAGHHAKAEPIREEVLEIRRRLQGNADSRTLSEMLSLAEDLQSTDKLDRARQLREEALNSCRKLQAPNSALTARALVGVSQSFAADGRSAEAISLLEEALRMRRALFGPYDQRTVASIQGLAELYAANGRLNEALRLQEEALESNENQFGGGHAASIQSKVRLGGLRLASGNRDEAMRIHQAVLPGMRNSVYPSEAVNEELLVFLEKWVDFSRTIRGPEHLETLEASKSLADAYIRVGQFRKAATICQELVALRRRIEAPDAPEFIEALRRLAATLALIEQPKESFEVLTEVADVLRKTKGSSSTETLSAVKALANTVPISDKGVKRLEFLEEARAISRRAYGAEHPETLEAILQVSETKYAMGKANESLAIVLEYMPVFRRVLGPDHGTTGRLFAHYGHVLDALGRTDEAIQAWKDAVALNPRWVNIQYWLGKALVAQHRYAEAVPVLRMSLQLLAPGEGYQDVSQRLAVAESMANKGSRKPLAYVIPSVGTPLADMVSSMKDWVAEHPEDTERAKHLALLHLWMGNANEHRDVCRRMLEAAAKSTEPTAHDRAAKAYLFQGRPDPGTLRMAVSSARSTLDLAAPNDPNVHWFRLVVGFAAYRSGDDEAADKFLTAAMQGSTDSHMRQLGLTVRTMVEWRSGHVEEARRDFAAAEKSMVEAPDRSVVSPTTRNPDKLAIFLAFEEARALLNSPIASQK